MLKATVMAKGCHQVLAEGRRWRVFVGGLDSLVEESIYLGKSLPIEPHPLTIPFETLQSNLFSEDNNEPLAFPTLISPNANLYTHVLARRFRGSEFQTRSEVGIVLMTDSSLEAAGGAPSAFAVSISDIRRPRAPPTSREV